MWPEDAPLGLTLRVAGPDEWEQSRDLRLEMLRDSPVAYGQSIEDAEAMTDADWQERHQRSQVETARLVAVVDQQGRWRGQMVVIDDRVTDKVWLVTVYLAADLRGTHAASAMLEVCIDWATGRGREALWLEVHERNPRAQAFYLKHGFVDTGERRPYDLDPSTNEIVMRLTLRP